MSIEISAMKHNYEKFRLFAYIRIHTTYRAIVLVLHNITTNLRETLTRYILQTIFGRWPKQGAPCWNMAKAR